MIVKDKGETSVQTHYNLRSEVTHLVEEKHIRAEDVDSVLKITGLSPDAPSWHNFIDKLLLVLGSLGLAFSLMFFIAYNWDDFGRFAQFGLVEAAILIATLIYMKTDTDKIVAKVALLTASILLGVLLALFGQTYQTGADPWELFFNWALLMLPWVIIGRFSALWVVWVVLMNISMILYYQTFGSLFWTYIGSEETLLWYLFAFNTIAVIIWELLSSYYTWLAEEFWGKRIIMVMSGTAITSLVLMHIFDKGSAFVSTLVWMIYLGGLYVVYRKVQHDLFMLAGACLSGIVVIIVFLSKHLLKNLDESGFFILMLSVIALGSLSALWLKSLYKEWYNA